MTGPEPGHVRPAERLSRRFSEQRRTGIAPELNLRRELHRRGRRSRVRYRIAGLPRRRADVVFTRWRLAVFVDGSFWHGCADHGVSHGSNSEWWQWKLESDQARNRDSDQRLQELGWTVLRVWEHEPSDSAADRVQHILGVLARST